MEITEVRIKLMENSDDRLQGFCSVTFDDSFVVRDLKIIEGSSGPFVAMPSRKLTSHCPHCGCKIVIHEQGFVAPLGKFGDCPVAPELERLIQNALRRRP